MKKFKAAIFDLDGTLIDSMGYWTNVDKEYLSRRNLTPPEDLLTDIKEGNSFLEVARHFKDKFNLPESVQEIILEWTLIVGGHYENDIALKPGAKEFLAFLKKKDVKLAIGTSNSLELANLALQSNGVIDFFDTIVTGCREIKGKPYPDIFLKAAENLGMEPDECFVCEDTLIGVQAAKNAGMSAIAVEDIHAQHDHQKIKQLADFFGKDFYAIRGFIEHNL